MIQGDCNGDNGVSARIQVNYDLRHFHFNPFVQYQIHLQNSNPSISWRTLDVTADEFSLLISWTGKLLDFLPADSHFEYFAANWTDGIQGESIEERFWAGQCNTQYIFEYIIYSPIELESYQINNHAIVMENESACTIFTLDETCDDETDSCRKATGSCTRLLPSLTPYNRFNR
ncbi:MAG: hypothetical protein JXR76_27715 [Deltaproteobacteria bacterium]|nr:hypothetical protein [Deltaproteobacteria bacterium]